MQSRHTHSAAESCNSASIHSGFKLKAVPSDNRLPSQPRNRCHSEVVSGSQTCSSARICCNLETSRSAPTDGPWYAARVSASTSDCSGASRSASTSAAKASSHPPCCSSGIPAAAGARARGPNRSQANIGQGGGRFIAALLCVAPSLRLRAEVQDRAARQALPRPRTAW